jgi:hypothetical protein
MNDYVTQRIDLARRVQFKFQLAQCYICADVYHREREFLAFAAEALYPTAYGPPVNSDERITLVDFRAFFQGGDQAEAPDSYLECFGQPGDPAEGPPRSYLSNFSVAALSLVTRERVLEALAQLPPGRRTVALLYLMGVRTYDLLAQHLQLRPDQAKEQLYISRQHLQDRVCSG